MSNCTLCGQSLGTGKLICRDNGEEIVIHSEKGTHYVYGLGELLEDIACSLRRIAASSGRRTEPSK